MNRAYHRHVIAVEGLLVENLFVEFQHFETVVVSLVHVLILRRWLALEADWLAWEEIHGRLVVWIALLFHIVDATNEGFIACVACIGTGKSSLAVISDLLGLGLLAK